jgi:predicted nucleic acid-binding protein
MISALVDASFLVALGYPRDNNHAQAKHFAAQGDIRLLLPDVVLPETMYNLRRVGGTRASLRFGDLLVSQGSPLVPLTTPDFARAMEVMRTYLEADLDLVDCCLTALAERLNITRICTFDRRDFSIIRPRHTDYFELLP